MLVYGVVFIVAGLNAFLNSKRTRHFSWILCIFIILIYSLRRNVGTDWPGYEFYFNNITSNTVIEQYNFEYGYWLLNFIFNIFFGSYGVLVSAVGIFNGILFWKASKKYSSNIGIIMLLSLYYLFFPTLEAFRQSITLFLFYFSIQFLQSNRNKYFILNILGLLFHSTGVFTLFFYFFYRYKIIKVLIVLSLLFFSLLEPYINEALKFFPMLHVKYEWYFHGAPVDNSIFNLKYLEYAILLIYYFILYRKQVINQYETLCFNLVSLGFIFQITLGQISEIIYRMAYYSDVGVLFTYAFIYDRIRSRSLKFIYIIFLIIYLFLRLYRAFPTDNPSLFYSF